MCLICQMSESHKVGVVVFNIIVVVVVAVCHVVVGCIIGVMHGKCKCALSVGKPQRRSSCFLRQLNLTTVVNLQTFQ